MTGTNPVRPEHHLRNRINRGSGVVVLFVRRPSVWPFFVGPVAGAAMGWASYRVGGAGGLAICTVVGAIIGVALAYTKVWYAKASLNLNLDTVELSIPKFSKLKFVVNDANRRVAWKLFIETVTRIATQPLDPGAGKLTEASASLYSLFTTTRKLLKNMEPSRVEVGMTVEVLAVRMMNHELRPFLSKWRHLGAATHPHLSEEQYRQELDSLRNEVLTYARAFGQLAGVKQLDQFIHGPAPVHG